MYQSKQLWRGQYTVNKNVKFKTSMLKSELYDSSDTYIVVKSTIDLLAAAGNENDQAEKNVAFKNNAPFKSGISKIKGTLTDKAEDLVIVILTYNILEYSQNYFMLSRSLWKYYRDETGELIMLMIMLQMVNHLNIKQK